MRYQRMVSVLSDNSAAIREEVYPSARRRSIATSRSLRERSDLVPGDVVDFSLLFIRSQISPLHRTKTPPKWGEMSASRGQMVATKGSFS